MDCVFNSVYIHIRYEYIYNVHIYVHRQRESSFWVCFKGTAVKFSHSLYRQGSGSGIYVNPTVKVSAKLGDEPGKPLSSRYCKVRMIRAGTRITRYGTKSSVQCRIKQLLLLICVFLVLCYYLLFLYLLGVLTPPDDCGR